MGGTITFFCWGEGGKTRTLVGCNFVYIEAYALLVVIVLLFRQLEEQRDFAAGRSLQ